MSKTKNKKSSFSQNTDDLKKHFESDAVDFKNVRDGPKATIIGSNKSSKSFLSVIRVFIHDLFIILRYSAILYILFSSKINLELFVNLS